MITRFFVFLSAIMLLNHTNGIIPSAYAATHHPTHKKKHSGKHYTAPSPASPITVPLTEQPGTELDKTARKLSADDLALAARHHEKPLVLIGTAHISSKVDAKALFIQLQSAGMCGSAGCSTSVYLYKNGEWVNVLDSVSGPISILPEEHEGMKDLMVDGSDKWIWHNGQYQDTLSATPPPAPARTHAKKHRSSSHRKAHTPSKTTPTPDGDDIPLKG